MQCLAVVRSARCRPIGAGALVALLLLSRGSTTFHNLSAAELRLDEKSRIAAGGLHSIAVAPDGTVWVWGENSRGQLGDGTTTDRLRPVQVVGLSEVVAVAAGAQTSYALKGDGSLWAWGANELGALGDGTNVDRKVPVPVESLTYAYDAAGRVERKSTPHLTERYSYDARSRLTAVDRLGDDVRHWAYLFDPSGNRTGAANDRDVTTSFYDDRNELLRQEPGGRIRIQGELSEPGTVKINDSPASLLSGNRFEATVDVPAGTSTVKVVATDGSGNLRENTYEVDVDGTRAEFEYDRNGNLVERTEGGTTWSYEWNGENELIRVLRDGVEVARFSYDPLGRRVQKVTAAASTSYTYDQDRILREQTSGETVLYVHGPQIDEPLAALRGGEPTYYHLDALGSVVSTSDAAGQRTSSRTYQPFGIPEEEIPSGFAFTGREWDAETGLYYYRARYYDPGSGRFLSEDPTFFEGGLNLYAYVGGDPVNRRDPNGTSWLGDAFDTVNSAWGIVYDKTNNKASKAIRRTLKKLLDAVDCLQEQLDCEDREGKPCRCGKD